jgi:hypothetical protein
MFSNWPTWKKVVAIVAILLLLSSLAVVGLIAWVNAQYDADSLETATIRDLRMERYMWLDEGCPQPPMIHSVRPFPDTNFNYVGTLVLSNHIYHGLFATKYGGWLTNHGYAYTFVVTTTGDILAVEDSGQVRLIKKANSW